MIQLKNVNFTYRKKKVIFENLNMQFEKGSIYGLLGKNGSGKTTLMKLISGLRYPGTGKITIDEKISRGRSPEYLSKLFLVPEEFDFPAITIKSFIKLNSPFYKGFIMTQFEYYLEEFHVPNNEKITSLSLGQKKKFLLAFGLACNTEVLLMDEPTNGLDIPSKRQFRKILASLVNDNRMFIISTHQIKDIEEIIDNVSIIDDGKMKFSSNINDIMDKLVFGDKELFKLDEFDILYEEKQLRTTRVIGRNNNSDFTPIDLELLFNAVTNGYKITEVFDNTKTMHYVNI